MHPLKQYPHNIVSSSKRQFILLSACLTIASLQIGAADSASEIRADLYYSVAEANYQMGDSEAANRVIDQILRIQSDHVAARQLRKQIKESPRPEKQAVNHTDTRKQNQTALIAPESQSTLATLGQAIDSDPTMQDLANYLRGRAALAKGRVGTARQHFEKALEQLPSPDDPLRPHILFHHALCFEKLNRQKQAETELLSALSAGYLPETQPDALQAARILLRMKAHKRALPILQTIARYHPDPTPEAWAMLGRAHQANKQLKRAISAYTQSLILDPEQVHTLSLRAQLHRQIGKLQLAIVDYQRAIQIAPKNRPLHYALGLLYLQVGAIGDARQCLRTAASDPQIPPVCHLFLALLEYNQDELPGARHYLREYLQNAQPEQINESAYYLEYLLTQRERGQEPAIQALRKRAEQANASADIGTYLAYCNGQMTRKSLLDRAGTAESSGAAQKQICEIAYWMAQHQSNCAQTESFRELLQISVRNGRAEWTEYQLAKDQLRRVPHQ